MSSFSVMCHSFMPVTKIASRRLRPHFVLRSFMAISAYRALLVCLCPQDGNIIFFQLAVMRYQGQVLNLSLGDQHAIERIAMMTR